MSAVRDWLANALSDGADRLSAGAPSALAAAAETVAALGAFAIAGGLAWIAWRRADLPGARRALLAALGSFVALSAALILVGAPAPDVEWSGPWAFAVVVLALLALAAAGLLWRDLPLLAQPLTPPAPARVPPAENGAREGDAARAAALDSLETARRELESRVAERTEELSLVKARLEAALRGAYVHAFSQDRDLRYTWVYDPDGAEAAAAMLGRTDDDVLPADVKADVIAAKRRVIATGDPETCEVCSIGRYERAFYSLHIEPALGADGRVEGVIGAAIDVSRVRSLESEQQRLAGELRAALRRYEIALRGSHVTLFTQDRDLRFTSISNPLFGREVSDIVGRADAEVLPADSREQFAVLARAALASGSAQGGEISAKEGDKTRWYDLHVEPLPDAEGGVAGVTCALFDITERKTGESHLRLLMRELTHRSKNLLAVIQSMARQTARHAVSIDGFLDAFGDRLQALATSHDLLVQEGWRGASLYELARRQLAKHIDGGERVTLSGPAIHLKPGAAQSFGLALHELAMNAERFGALSVPQGRVDVHWRKVAATLGDDDRAGGREAGVEIVWAEHGGPDVTAPSRRGFGSLVVEKNLARALDADVALAFEPSGVRCRMLIPASHLFAGR